MSNGILFLVLPQNTVAKVEGLVREHIVPDKRETVLVLSDAGASRFHTNIKYEMARELIAQISTYPKHADNQLMIGHEANCSFEDLADWWRDQEFGRPKITKLKPTPLRREVEDYLKATGRHWRVHAETELRAFDGPHHLATWLQQLGSLGCSNIGRKLAAKLRVIRTADPSRSAFALRATDVVGHRQASCYVQDDDSGGSWVEMQSILTHTWPPGMVFPVAWDKVEGRLSFPQVDVDEFVIHEDGLWSGIEAVRRLVAIAAAPPPVPVTLRFRVVTDFGLRIARHAIRTLGLSGRVTIDATGAELLRFLKPDLPERLQLGLELSREMYAEQLHQHVQPFAFSVASDWTDDEIQACEEIGGQLVHHWLAQGATKPPSSAAVGRFALGGGRFASTVVFSRSVPKVCLPLLWLDGPVRLNGKEVTWRPLFVDARRVSDSTLLFPAKGID